MSSYGGEPSFVPWGDTAVEREGEIEFAQKNTAKQKKVGVPTSKKTIPGSKGKGGYRSPGGGNGKNTCEGVFVTGMAGNREKEFVSREKVR